MDEILVKGTDGKWYILKGEEMVPFEEPAQISVAQKFQSGEELPKGVSAGAHERMEKEEVRRKKEESPSPQPSPIRPERSGPKAAERGGLAGIPAPPFPVISHEEHPLRVELEELVDSVMQNVKLKMQNVEWLKDQILQKRFRNIVSARLRDVRDAQETREMLARGQKVGGMGLPPPQTPPQGGGEKVDLIMEQIEKAFKEFQEKWRAVEEKRREEWVRARREQQGQREQREQQIEERELEERYQKLTGRTAENPAEEEGKGKQKMIAPPPPAVVKLDTKATKAPLAPTAPPHPAYIRRPPSPLGRGEGEGGRQPSAVSSKPNKITDIRPAPKLQGPVEEVGALTVKDFRRLAQTPQERVEKIVGRLDFIGKEGLGRRLKAMEALRGSPLMREYQRIVQESFAKRVNPDALLSQNTEEQSAGLTAEEFYAIMEMNQKLRF